MPFREVSHCVICSKNIIQKLEVMNNALSYTIFNDKTNTESTTP